MSSIYERCASCLPLSSYRDVPGARDLTVVWGCNQGEAWANTQPGVWKGREVCAPSPSGHCKRATMGHEGSTGGWRAPRGAVQPGILLPMRGLPSPDWGGSFGGQGVRLWSQRQLSGDSARLLPSTRGSLSPCGDG